MVIKSADELGKGTLVRDKIPYLNPQLRAARATKITFMEMY
jgi:hypothetical protein